MNFSKLIIAAFPIIFLVNPASCKNEVWGSYGGYLQHDLDLTHSPFSFRSALTNGNYGLQLGWVEPVAPPKHKGMFSNTYMNPSVQFDFFPYSSEYSVLFNLKFLKWINGGIGYKRLLFHKSMIAFKNKPQPREWKPIEIIKNMPFNGELAGADIFLFFLSANLSIPYFLFNINTSAEKWDVDASGNEYVYLYSKDLLIKAQDNIYGLEATVKILPQGTNVPTIKNYYVYANLIELEKNLFSLGLTNIPILRINKISLDLFVGYWIRHSQIEQDGIFESLNFSAHINWDIVLINQ